LQFGWRIYSFILVFNVQKFCFIFSIKSNEIIDQPLLASVQGPQVSQDHGVRPADEELDMAPATVTRGWLPGRSIWQETVTKHDRIK
jgi:hypothetical protein